MFLSIHRFAARVMCIFVGVVVFGSMTVSHARVAGAVSRPLLLADTSDHPVFRVSGEPVSYRPPVDAPIVDGFRPPTTPFGPGNRGLEFATASGTAVVAAAAGEVIFAGLVAGTRHVTILHADGVRTSYSFLDALAVTTGRVVQAGQAIGLAGDRTFFSARLRDAYLDPAILLGASSDSTVRLVPDRRASAAAARRVEPREMLWLAAAESADDPSRLRRAITWARGAVGSASGLVAATAEGTMQAAVDAAVLAAGAAGTGARGVASAWSVAAGGVVGGSDTLAVAWRAAWQKARATGATGIAAWLVAVREVGDQVVGVATFPQGWPGSRAPALAIASNAIRGARRLRSQWRQRSHCTPPAVAPPPVPTRRIMVLVGGLGSSSATAAIDGLRPETLGYAPGDVLRFSYQGGRVPDPRDGLTTIEAHDYDPGDTQVDMRVSGRRLADLLAAVAGAEPGVPIDVVAHSQGGIVARVAIAELMAQGAGARASSALPATLVTLGSPHQGADLATAVATLAGTPIGGSALEAIQQLAHTPLEPRAPSVGQLAESSSLLRELDRAGPPPPSVHAVAVGARSDVVVAAGQTAFEGADAITIAVPGWNDHANLPASPGARRAVALAVARLPPTCEPWLDAVADVAVSELVSTAEDVLGGIVAARLGP